MKLTIDRAIYNYIPMKKLSYLLPLTVVLLTACGGKNNRDAADSLADTGVVTAADTIPAAPADIVITADGIGPVKIGMLTDQIPPEHDGIYDSIHSEEGYESNTYLFLDGETPLFTAYEFTKGTLDVISAESPRVVVVGPDDIRLHLGDEFSGVLALPGVEAQWENADGEGMWCWTWQGLWFQPDQSHLSEQLSRELYSDVAPPAKSSFTPDAKIGYIGTGLPW